MPQRQIETTLGAEYKDRVTGMKGIAISASVFMYSCERVHIQPQEVKDGKPAEGGYYDYHEFVGPGVSEHVQKQVAGFHEQKKPTGGFGDPAPRQDSPAR